MGLYTNSFGNILMVFQLYQLSWITNQLPLSLQSTNLTGFLNQLWLTNDYHISCHGETEGLISDTLITELMLVKFSYLLLSVTCSRIYLLSHIIINIVVLIFIFIYLRSSIFYFCFVHTFFTVKNSYTPCSCIHV